MKSAPPGVAIIVATALILAFGYFVWPSHYRYDHIHGNLVRVDRVTGRVDAFSPSGWFCLQGCAESQSSPPNKKPEVIDTLALWSLKFNLRLDNVGYINGSLYNGTTAWTVRSVKYRIVVYGKDGKELLSREYLTTTYVPPLQNKDFIENVGISWDTNTMARWTIDIEGATGTQETTGTE